MVHLILQVIRFVEPRLLCPRQVILQDVFHRFIRRESVIEFASTEPLGVSLTEFISLLVVLVELVSEGFFLKDLHPEFGVVIISHRPIMFVCCHSLITLFINSFYFIFDLKQLKFIQSHGVLGFWGDRKSVV